MILSVALFIVASLFTFISIGTTETPKYISQEDPLLICSLGNKWAKCSDFVKLNVDNKRHYRGLRHLIGIGTNSDIRSESRRLLASKVLSYLSLQNRRKLERHASAMRRVVYPALRTLSESNRNGELLYNFKSPLTKDFLSNYENNDESIADNSLTTVMSNIESYTVKVNINSGYTETETYNTRYPEVTKNELIDTVPKTEEPFNEAYIKPFYSFKSFKEIISIPLNKLSEEIRKQYKTTTFLRALSEFERKFHITTFEKLTLISPVERQENGISFVQSGLFSNLLLMGLSTITDIETAREINNCIGLNMTGTEKTELISEVLSALPNSSDGLKWRWSSRLVLGPSQEVSEEFGHGAASALRLVLDKFNGTESPEVLATTLNHMVEKDSGGAIRDAFEVDEMSDGVRAVALTTLYLRATWRSAPTVLNGTRPFRDADRSPIRTVRMIRINDVMRYANLEEWKFHAIEISYSTPGLSLLMLVPYEPSLRSLVKLLAYTSLDEITSRMVTNRIAVSMPIYTLRMTLLLPSKLQAMGVNRLFDWNSTDSDTLRLSHAVQRLMFWAEAGRNAYKDDGLEWDEIPKMELVVDRPYLFFVRWKNLTLMNGNFVL